MRNGDQRHMRLSVFERKVEDEVEVDSDGASYNLSGELHEDVTFVSPCMSLKGQLRGIFTQR